MKTRRFTGAIVTVVTMLSFFLPGIQVNASADRWTRINEAVENMMPKVRLQTSEFLTWADLLSLEYGAANIESFHSCCNPDGTYTYEFYYTLDSLDDYEAMKEELDSIAAEIAAGIPEDASSVEKARYIHDWLIINTTYDYDLSNPDSRNIYGVLHDHVGICGGFAAAFKFLMNYVGEECSIVQSYQHVWNQISVDPDIFIDCCWDNRDYAADDGSEDILYNYFALEEDAISSVDFHRVVFDRSEDSLSSHPEYLSGDSIATVAFDSYDADSITDYCSRMYELGYLTFTIDFNNENAYLSAYEQMPYCIYRIEEEIGFQEPLNWIPNDNLQVINIYVGERHDMVNNRG